jgi:hypothetical protein
VADLLPALTAIRECLLGVIGDVRTVPDGALVERAYPSTIEHEAARALTGPRFEVSVDSFSPSPDGPWEHSPYRLHVLELSVRTEWTTAHELLDDERARVRAEALSLLETCRAALMRAGNIATTSGGDETGIVSGCLHRCLGHQLEREDWQHRRLSYVSRYTTQIRIEQTAG